MTARLTASDADDPTLMIVRDGDADPARPGLDSVPWPRLKRRLLASPRREVLRDRRVVVRVHRLDLMERPLALAAIARTLGRRECTIEDHAGRRQQIGFQRMAQLIAAAARDAVEAPALLRSVRRHVSALERAPARRVTLHRHGRPVYLRTDALFGLESGGSVAHTAGILNELGSVWGTAPVFLTTDRIPGVDASVETRLIPPPQRYRDFGALRELDHNRVVRVSILGELAHMNPAFIYQRYTLDSYAGLEAARALRVPFVLEFNGSEVWIRRNWGHGLGQAVLAQRIEHVVTRSADLVVVISEALGTELAARGVDRDRIVVSPNGVDPARYRPEVDGRVVREALGIGDRTVIGFIGTFEQWHGAEVLAEAFIRLVERRPMRRDGLRLLMIGDGPLLPDVRRRIQRAGLSGATIFTGRTRQADGPRHLAACDILVSPHVRNPDDSPFFGSPTKLFEYMAMGRAIVASRLGQLDEILDDKRTALLVEPGDPDELAVAIETLVDDPELRARLGSAARVEVVRGHSWRARTEQIIDALERLYG